MDDYLYILKLELEQKLPKAVVNDRIQEYEDYINAQTAAGYNLETVLRELGDPTELAKMLIADHERKPDWEQMKDMTAEEINATIKNPEKGIKAEFKENEGWDIRLGGFKLNSWYGTLTILVIVLVVSILLKKIAP